MAVARRIYVNPANTAQRYVLWSNGYIENRGGALAVAQSEGSVNSWPSTDAPTFYTWSNPDVAVALFIVDWTIPKGYTLDVYGHVWAWGGASTVPGASAAPLTGGPEFYFGLSGGFASPLYGYVIDFTMDPAGNGKGYFLQYDGDLIAFGTGVVATARMKLPGDTAARALEMDWTSKRYWILDNLGRVVGVNGGNSPAIVDSAAVSATYPSYVWGRGGSFAQGGFKLYDKSATPRGWVLDSYGRAYQVGAAVFPVGAPGGNVRNYVDLSIIDDGTASNPLRLVALNAQGAGIEWVASTAPTTYVFAPTGTITTATRPWVRWNYTDPQNNPQKTYDVRVISSAVYLSGTTNEVQRLTPGGTISGGTFTITFAGQTTSAIAFNASAATIQAALEALPNVGTGGIVCAGGPMNSAFVSLTFSAQMAGWDWAQVTVNTSLLTGTTPTITPTTTTAGVGIDPAVAGNVYSKQGTDAATRSVQVGVDLANATYRAYVRSTDSSDLASAWSFQQFTVNVAAMSTPTVTPTVVGGLGGVSLALSVATGGLDPLARFLVQFSDDAGTTWSNVRNGFGLTPVSGAATVIDYDAPFGKQRGYRVAIYIYDATTDSWRQSSWSTTGNATLTPRSVWALTCPSNSALGATVRVQPGFKITRPIRSGTFWASGRDDPIVVTDGKPKFGSFPLQLWTLTNAERVAVEAMADADAVLLLRDPFGRALYFRLVDTFEEEVVRAVPTATELTSIRDMHAVRGSGQAVRRPVGGPTFGPWAGT